MPPGLLERLKAALAVRYAIEREIGRGGMAIVYRAADLRNRRPVAIKILKPELASVVGPDRFLREIEIVANLTHPHILPLHDSGEADEFLYYVMPFVEGESLQRRLKRAGPLPLEEALRVTREVAGALDYAHARGILHRDVKPANILFQAEHALVSDFGIARAVSVVGREQLTETGLAVGTPGYTSPEQTFGERELDARTDQYSLGCVVYEMLAGERPFTGSSAQAILGKQFAEPPPSIHDKTANVPRAIDEAIRRALQRDPCDRFPTLTDFVEALDSAGDGARRRSAQRIPRPRRWRTALAVGGAVASIAMALALWLAFGPEPERGTRGAPVDSLRYLILPFEYDPEVGMSLNEVQLIHDAMSRWTGLSIVDPFQVREGMPPGGAQAITYGEASKLALGLGAGRYLRGSISRLGDSLRVHAGLHDALDGELLFDRTMRLRPDPGDLGSMFTEISDRLLFQGLLADGDEAFSGTRSFPARMAFIHGQKAFDAWDLARADSAFAAATRLDGSYARAQMWLAVVRSWMGAEPASWRVPAEQAALGRDSLTTWEEAVADALLWRARGDFGRACEAWNRLTETTPREFVAWYGWADCLIKDEAVLADEDSPSGWSFRASYNTALRAYERAFVLRPSILRSLRSDSFERLRDLFLTAGNRWRSGHSLTPDTTEFIAAPAWQADSIAFVPYPFEPQPGHQIVRPTHLDKAVQHLRSRFRDAALAWVSAAPGNAYALEVLAISLAMLSDPAALDSLRRARALAEQPEDRMRMAGIEVWMGLALSVPSDAKAILRARELTDSILSGSIPGGDSESLMLAGLAALTGRAHLAASYARTRSAAKDLAAPPPLTKLGPSLLVYSAMGGPVDTLAALEDRVRSTIEESLLPRDRPLGRRNWLARPASLAFPTYRFRSLPELVGLGDYLIDAQAAWASGDSTAVRVLIENVSDLRRDVRPSDITLDALYPEAELLVALGDLRGAVDWLDPTLRSLSPAAPQRLANPASSASLVRAMALRAWIAGRLGHRNEAQAWAAAVVTLWSDADPFLQPMVAEMSELLE